MDSIFNFCYSERYKSRNSNATPNSFHFVRIQSRKHKNLWYQLQNSNIFKNENLSSSSRELWILGRHFAPIISKISTQSAKYIDIFHSQHVYSPELHVSCSCCHYVSRVCRLCVRQFINHMCYYSLCSYHMANESIIWLYQSIRGNYKRKWVSAF